MKHLFNDYVQTLETYIMFQIKQAAARLKPELDAKNRTPIPLSMGAPTQAPPKFITERLKEVLDEPNIHTYSTSKAEPFFLEAISKRMKKVFDVDVDAKTEVCSLIGSKEGIANIIRALSNPTTVEKDKDIILVPDPGYASYKEMAKASGCLAYSIPLLAENNYEPDLEDVMTSLEKDGYDKKKVKAVIINYPNNPLGVTTTIDYMKKVVDFCKKYNILLISDAAYVDLTFGDAPKAPSILQVPGAKDIAVEFYSFSKPYAMTGWRLGWVCGNAEAVGFLSKLKSTIDTGIFKALQKVGAEALLSDECDEYIIQSNKGFEVKQSIVLNGLRKLGWDIDNMSIPKATFYLWLPIPQKYKTSKEFADDLLKTSGVIVVPGTAFGKYGEGFFRLSFVASDEKLQEAMDRMLEDGFHF